MPHGFWGVAGIFGIVFMVVIGIMLLWTICFTILYWIDVVRIKREKGRVRAKTIDRDKTIVKDEDDGEID